MRGLRRVRMVWTHHLLSQVKTRTKLGNGIAITVRSSLRTRGSPTQELSVDGSRRQRTFYAESVFVHRAILKKTPA